RADRGDRAARPPEPTIGREGPRDVVGRRRPARPRAPAATRRGRPRPAVGCRGTLRRPAVGSAASAGGRGLRGAAGTRVAWARPVGAPMPLLLLSILACAPPDDAASRTLVIAAYTTPREL